MKKKPKVAIIGIGFMGASLALALKKRQSNLTVYGFARKQEKIRQAVKEQIIDKGSTDLSKVISNVDIIIVCTPVETIVPLVKKCEKLAKQGTIITDIGSTKKTICRDIAKLHLKKVSFVGSHPLCGSHLTGMEFASEALYEDATCFVALDKKVDTNALESIVSFWELVGCRSCLIEPDKHDEVMAATSHFPHLLAYSLIQSVSKSIPEALQFVGSGFRDTTRIAEGDASLWIHILKQNKKNVAKQLDEMIQELQKAKKLLKSKDATKLKKYLQKSNQIRKKL